MPLPHRLVERPLNQIDRSIHAFMSELTLIAVLDEGPSALPALTAALRTRRLHTVYIDPLRCGSVHAFGELWHEALSKTAGFDASRDVLSPAEEESLRHLRGGYRFRAETDPRITIQHSEHLNGWTLICEEDPHWSASLAASQVYLKPMPHDWNQALLYTDTPLDRAALWPASPEHGTAMALQESLPVKEWVSLES